MRALRLSALFALWLVVTGIYGGERVRGGEGDSIVFFETRDGNDHGACSGVLIAPRLVLSAGHCAVTPEGRRRRIRRVRIGVARGTVQNVRVERVVAHPDFDAAHPERGNDLALLHLREDARATPIPFVTTAEDEASRHVRVLGFGMTSPRPQRNPRLHAAALEHLSPFHCFSGPVARMAETRGCAASPQSGVCPGDSGGPILAQVDGTTKLLGIVSLAINDVTACTHSATVFTRVTAFDEWIRAEN